MFEELRQDFVEDTLPLLTKLESYLLEFEQSAVQPDPEQLHEVMSLLHTIKGNAGMMGMTAIQSLAHSMEDVVKQLGHIPKPNLEQGLDLLLASVTLTGELIHLVSLGREGEAEIGEQLEQLQEFHKTPPGEPSPTVGERLETQAFGQAVPETRKTDPPTTSRMDSQKFQIPREQSPGKSRELHRGAESIRVDFRKLDDLLNLVGELVIYQTALERSLHEVASSVQQEQWRPLENTAESLKKSVLSLQQAVMQTRLLPVSTIFNRFERSVRDLAKKQGKEVRLILRGQDTEIDKTILDALADPLLHLVRNAIDHGLESPEQRLSAGKTETGTLLLSAAQIGKQIRIDVGDDGRGLRPEKLRERAQKMGYELSGMDARQLQELIFLPGFSTAEQVTELSGRGVGLDVVRRHIERLGGHLLVSSAPGRGTRFTLLMPLTLALVEALLADVAGELYALPVSGVIETQRFDPSRVHRIGDLPVFRWRDQVVPIIDLGRMFQLGESSLDKANFMVAIFAGGRVAMLPVQKLFGREELVIKGLDEPLGEPPGIAGAAILGTGRVLLVLDLAALISRRDRRPGTRPELDGERSPGRGLSLPVERSSGL